jgi:5-methyltetrahydrofolate--homocysteine methyltransferase
MEREGFEIPLLIGGATTSRIHTAVKIAPAFHGPVVHVIDASRAVGVAGSLMNPDLREEFSARNRQDQEAAREDHRGRTSQRRIIPLAQARGRKPRYDWKTIDIPRPAFLGTRCHDSFPIDEIVPYIDWSPFFHTWELRGRYPQILDDPAAGEKARELLKDAHSLLERIVADRLLAARGVYGLFAANSVEDDIEIYAGEDRSGILTVLHTLRQQAEKPAGQFNLALADFVAPRTSGIPDYVGAFAVTAGIGLEDLCRAFERDHDDYSAIMAKALADRLAEAYAELLHKTVRQEWGYGREENLTSDDLIKERYRGIRPAPGYPACPDHTEKRLLFDLLQVEQRTGICLTESFAMLPASSVSGFYFAHPDARYFAVGKIGLDQVQDYQRRKGMERKVLERWLSANLAYDPEEQGTPVAVQS